MKYDSIQARNQAANLFYQAAEGAKEREIRQAVRAIGDEIMECSAGDFSPEKAEALEKLGRSIGEYARYGLREAIRNYKERVHFISTDRKWAAETNSNSKGGKPMGFMKKLFGPKETPVKSMANDEIGKAQKAVEAAEADMELYDFEYRNEKEAYNHLFEQLKTTAQNDPGYKILVSKINQKKQRIQALDERITLAFKTIAQNQQYLSQLGKLEQFDKYKKMVPDAAKAQVILDEVTQKAQDLAEQFDEVNEILGAVGGSSSLTSEDVFLDPEIAAQLAEDQAMEEAKKQAAEEAKKQAAEEAKAQAEAEEKQKMEETVQTAEENMPSPEQQAPASAPETAMTE